MNLVFFHYLLVDLYLAPALAPRIHLLYFLLQLLLYSLSDAADSVYSRSEDLGDRLNTSLSAIDPKVDSMLLEQEVKRLNESYGGIS